MRHQRPSTWQPPARFRRLPAASPLPESSLAVSRWAAERLAFTPDPAQAQVLDSPSRHLLLCCSRQWGKSTVTAIRALHHAWFQAGALVLCVAPSERQSCLFLEKVRGLAARLAVRPKKDPRDQRSLRLPNGSAVIALPATPATIRGFSGVAFLVIDEAALVPDSTYQAVRPMLAATDGALWLLSTPNGQSGFFYDEWTTGGPHWDRHTVPATECSRIAADFLARERTALGERAFRQEYLCEFTSSLFQLLPQEVLEASLCELEQHTLLAETVFYLGVDLGLRHDPSVVVVLEDLTRETGWDAVNLRKLSERRLELRLIQALPLETPYFELPSLLETLLARLPAGRRHVTIDATGVGAPVVELLQRSRLGVSLHPIVMTAGEAIGHLPHATTVPRHVLVENLRLLFETTILKIPRPLEGLPELLKELRTLGPCKSSHPDDRAIALSLAAWQARPNPAHLEGQEPFPGTPGGDRQQNQRLYDLLHPKR